MRGWQARNIPVSSEKLRESVNTPDTRSKHRQHRGHVLEVSCDVQLLCFAGRPAGGEKSAGLVFIFYKQTQRRVNTEMRLLRKVFFQLINKKLARMRELHDEDAVVLRRTNRKAGRPDNNCGNLGSARRLSWSISDLSRLPVVKTNTLLKTRCSRVRNASISSCSLSSGLRGFDQSHNLTMIFIIDICRIIQLLIAK